MIENAFNKPDPDLLPCPLCGGEAFFMTPIGGVGRATIMCAAPGCIEMSMGIRDNRLQDLADRWNRRMGKQDDA